jgi:hypothetical protein
MGVEVSHDGNDSPGSTVPLFTVLNGLDVVDHLLNVPSVFWKDQLLPVGVVIVI